MAKVIHIHLTHGIEGTKRKDWYFSSITAIYTVLTAEQVGATKNYLHLHRILHLIDLKNYPNIQDIAYLMLG